MAQKHLSQEEGCELHSQASILASILQKLVDRCALYHRGTPGDLAGSLEVFLFFSQEKHK
ncbi:hypothetical protein AVEN_211033-1, partial [Araneus ventricosus]